MHSILLRPFPYLGSAHRVFNLHVLRSCASSIFTCFSFMPILITSPHLSFCLPIFRCRTTFMLSLPHLLQYFSPHGLTISFSYFILMFATPALALISSFLIFSILFIPIIHFNVLISVLSSKFWSAFLSAQV